MLVTPAVFGRIPLNKAASSNTPVSIFFKEIITAREGGLKEPGFVLPIGISNAYPVPSIDRERF